MQDKLLGLNGIIKKGHRNHLQSRPVLVFSIKDCSSCIIYPMKPIIVTIAIGSFLDLDIMLLQRCAHFRCEYHLVSGLWISISGTLNPFHV